MTFFSWSAGFAVKQQVYFLGTWVENFFFSIKDSQLNKYKGLKMTHRETETKWRLMVLCESVNKYAAWPYGRSDFSSGSHKKGVTPLWVPLILYYFSEKAAYVTKICAKNLPAPEQAALSRNSLRKQPEELIHCWMRVKTTHLRRNVAEGVSSLEKKKAVYLTSVACCLLLLKASSFRPH